MKFIDERGRFFGLLNIVDIAIIIIVLLVVGVGGMYVLKKKNVDSVEQATRPMSYTVEFQHLNQATIEAVKKGQQVFNSSTSAYLGVIEDFKVVPQKAVIANTTLGVYEEHQIPGEMTLYLTIKGNGSDNARSIVIENHTVKVGKQLNVKGKGYAFPGYIVDIKID